ncbi:MAG: class I SAM-dependent methyltransferase [Polyangiales bacterium]
MIIDPREAMMERVLVEAGVSRGMRVLDLGCGHGTVSQMIARQVGAEGRVVGVDRDPRVLEVARSAARERGYPQIAFVQCDLHALPDDLGPFDAAVGRRVLMYQPDPAATLRAVVRALRPGAVVALQEIDATTVPAASTPMPLHEQVYRWVWEMVAREGASRRMGLDLPGAMTRAGITAVDVRVECVMQTAARRLPTAAMVRAVLPRIVERGVATEAEVDVDTLDQRLDDELRETGGAFVGDALFSAWGTV